MFFFFFWGGAGILFFFLGGGVLFLFLDVCFFLIQVILVSIKLNKMLVLLMFPSLLTPFQFLNKNKLQVFSFFSLAEIWFLEFIGIFDVFVEWMFKVGFCLQVCSDIWIKLISWCFYYLQVFCLYDNRSFSFWQNCAYDLCVCFFQCFFFEWWTCCWLQDTISIV